MLVKTRHLRNEALGWAANSLGLKSAEVRKGVVLQRSPGGAQPAWTATLGELQAQGDDDDEALLRVRVLQQKGEEIEVPDQALAHVLCWVFMQELRRVVTPADYEEICRRNQRRDHPLVCHSHDFVDANMVMASAFTIVTGIEVDTQDDAHRALWSDAWSKASVRLANYALPQPSETGEQPTASA